MIFCAVMFIVVWTGISFVVSVAIAFIMLKGGLLYVFLEEMSLIIAVLNVIREDIICTYIGVVITIAVIA